MPIVSNEIEVIARTLHAMEDATRIDFINPDDQPKLTYFLIDTENWVNHMRKKYDMPVYDQPDPASGKNVIVIEVGKLTKQQRKEWGNGEKWCWTINIWDEAELALGQAYGAGPHCGGNIGGQCTQSQFEKRIADLLKQAEEWEKDWNADWAPSEIWLTTDEGAYPSEFQYKLGLDLGVVYQMLRLMSV